MTMIACVGYVARVSATCRNPNVALLAGLTGAAASAGLYALMMRWRREDYARKEGARTPSVFYTRWSGQADEKYREQLRRVRTHELTEAAILGLLIGGSFLWAAITAIAHSRPF